MFTETTEMVETTISSELLIAQDQFANLLMFDWLKAKDIADILLPQFPHYDTTKSNDSFVLATNILAGSDTALLEALKPLMDNFITQLEEDCEKENQDQQ